MKLVCLSRSLVVALAAAPFFSLSSALFLTVLLVTLAHGAATEAPYRYLVEQPPDTPPMTRSAEQKPISEMKMILPSTPPDAKPSADPRNIEGVWIHAEPVTSKIRTTMTGILVPFNEAGAKVVTDRIMADNNGHPFANTMTSCRPSGITREFTVNFPFRVFQSKSEIVFLFEEFHSLWQIQMSPTARPPAQREYNGFSVGHWDGNTLVVETTRYKVPLWIDSAGAPVSTEGKVTHRMRKIDGGYFMEVITTVDDPTYYTQSWSFARKMAWRPERFLSEYNCEASVGDEAGDSSYGLKQEGVK